MKLKRFFCYLPRILNGHFMQNLADRGDGKRIHAELRVSHPDQQNGEKRIGGNLSAYPDRFVQLFSHSGYLRKTLQNRGVKGLEKIGHVGIYPVHGQHILDQIVGAHT